jgi:predicted nucleotidyltransferase
VLEKIVFSQLLYNDHMALQSRDLSSSKLGEYRKTAIRRQTLRISKVKTRRELGWKLAKKAAQLLRSQFQAKRVAVFGSLLHEARFTPWSDIDIAAWGIPSDQTFRAIGAVLDLDSSLEINLVDVNTCSPNLLKAIEKEAVDL